VGFSFVAGRIDEVDLPIDFERAVFSFGDDYSWHAFYSLLHFAHAAAGIDGTGGGGVAGSFLRFVKKVPVRQLVHENIWRGRRALWLR
jgi:hypothetical protein